MLLLARCPSQCIDLWCNPLCNFNHQCLPGSASVNSTTWERARWIPPPPPSPRDRNHPPLKLSIVRTSILLPNCHQLELFKSQDLLGWEVHLSSPSLSQTIETSFTRYSSPFMSAPALSEIEICYDLSTNWLVNTKRKTNNLKLRFLLLDQVARTLLQMVKTLKVFPAVKCWT